MDDTLSDIFNDKEFGGEDLFAILESLQDINEFSPITSKQNEQKTRLLSHKSSTTSSSEPEAETSPKYKKRKKLLQYASTSSLEEPIPNGQERNMSHITVERNRRKQMNEHLSVLRTLMPCFYVKRGDQASIIEGVVDYINELHQLLQCLEAKKHRKLYNEVLSPRVLVSSPRPSPLSPRKPPLSPRIVNLPISPRSPQPCSPYKPRLQLQLQQCGGGYISPTISNSNIEPSPTSSASSNINDNILNELVATSKSSFADVEVKFSGPNVLLKTVSPPIPGQALRIMLALEELALEIIHVNVSTSDETMVNSFTIKIGIECQLSAEELAQQIQQTFC